MFRHPSFVFPFLGEAAMLVAWYACYFGMISPDYLGADAVALVTTLNDLIGTLLFGIIVTLMLVATIAIEVFRSLTGGASPLSLLDN